MALTAPKKAVAARPAAAATRPVARAPQPKAAAVAAAPAAHASLLEFSQGGLIDDIDVTILDAAFCEWDYNGNIAEPALALAVQYEDVEGKTYDQYYSAGDLQYFQPSEDGGFAVPVADKQLMNDNTNAAKFLLSVAEQGGGELLGTGSVKSLTGLKCHVNRVPQPKRTGLIRGGKNADREQTILLVTAILEMPGQTTAPAKKAAPKVAPKAAAGVKAANKPNGRVAQAAAAAPAEVEATDEASPLAELAQEILLTEILTDEEGNPKEPMAKKQINILAFRAAGKAATDGRLDMKDKQKLVQLLYQDSFLNELATAGLIDYDGAQISLAAA